MSRAKKDPRATVDGGLHTPLQITTYLHCGKCLAERPPDQTPREWGSYEVGCTATGVQVWCKRHDVNIAHIEWMR